MQVCTSLLKGVYQLAPICKISGGRVPTPENPTDHQNGGSKDPATVEISGACCSADFHCHRCLQAAKTAVGEIRKAAGKLLLLRFFNACSFDCHALDSSPGCYCIEMNGAGERSYNCGHTGACS